MAQGANDSTSWVKNKKINKRSGTCGGTKVVCECAANSVTRPSLQGRETVMWTGPRGRSLISHAVGWNNNHSGCLYVPMHRPLKTVFKAYQKGFKSAISYIWTCVFIMASTERTHVMMMMAVWFRLMKHLDHLNLSRKPVVINLLIGDYVIL